MTDVSTNIINLMMYLNLLARSGFVLLLLLAQTNEAAAATAPSLGAASSFAVLGGASVTNTGATAIIGELGVSPGTSVTGFPPGSVTGGTIHLNDAAASSAQTDLTTAYDDLAGQTCITTISADLGGMTLIPGVYCSGSSMALTGTLTLDAEGDPDAVWVFQMPSSTLTTAAGSSVLLINGGQQSNVFWQVGSSATLGTNTAFAGNIIAFTSITLNTGASVSGRVLARNGTVTMDTNSISLFPIITIVKSSIVYEDPVNGTDNPKAIPGSEIVYTITVTNSGSGVVDNNTTVVTELIPANMSMCVSTLCSDPPVDFFCSSAPDGCGLTYTYATDVTYSNQVGGGEPYDYSAVPDGAGYDANITGVRINPAGIFNGKNVGDPSFSLFLKMMIK